MIMGAIGPAGDSADIMGEKETNSNILSQLEEVCDDSAKLDEVNF